MALNIGFAACGIGDFEAFRDRWLANVDAVDKIIRGFKLVDRNRQRQQEKDGKYSLKIHFTPSLYNK